jgi:putative DNA primase/helicase
MSDQLLKEQVNARVDEEALSLSKVDESGKSVVTFEYIDKCLRHNEMGDAYLIVATEKDNFIYIPERDLWAYWKDHSWNFDTKDGAAIRAAVGQRVATLYENRAWACYEEEKKAITEAKPDEAAKLKDKAKSMRSRAFSLRSKRRVSAVIPWVYSIDDSFKVSNADVDTNPYFWAFNNGVVDIRTGELSPGNPSDHIFKVSPFDWPGIDAVPKRFLKLLDTSLAAPPGTKNPKDYNKRIVEYAHRYIGHSCSGEIKERAFMILYGHHGWNGKGTIMETLLYCMGPLAHAMNAEFLMEKKGDVDPDKPSSTKMSMQGRRILSFSETGKNQKWAEELIKKYSSTDTITGRAPHDKEDTSFKPSHTIYIMTNRPPWADANDNAFWGRMHILPFYWSFVETPTETYVKKFDPDLEYNLKKEAPAICAWIVRGYLKYKKAGGLFPPPETEKVKNLYRYDNDLLAQWMNDCCKEPEKVDATKKERFSDLFASYEKWFKDNVSKKKEPTKIAFTRLLGEKGYEKNEGGTRYVYGIELINPLEL